MDIAAEDNKTMSTASNGYAVSGVKKKQMFTGKLVDAFSFMGWNKAASRLTSLIEELKQKTTSSEFCEATMEGSSGTHYVRGPKKKGDYVFVGWASSEHRWSKGTTKIVRYPGSHAQGIAIAIELELIEEAKHKGSYTSEAHVIDCIDRLSGAAEEAVTQLRPLKNSGSVNDEEGEEESCEAETENDITDE